MSGITITVDAFCTECSDHEHMGCYHLHSIPGKREIVAFFKARGWAVSDTHGIWTCWKCLKKPAPKAEPYVGTVVDVFTLARESRGPK